MKYLPMLSLVDGVMSPANIRASILSGSLDSVDLVVVKCVPPTFSSTMSSIFYSSLHGNRITYIFARCLTALGSQRCYAQFNQQVYLLSVLYDVMRRRQPERQGCLICRSVFTSPTCSLSAKADSRSTRGRGPAGSARNGQCGLSGFAFR